MNHLIHVTGAGDTPNTALFNILTRIAEPADPVLFDKTNGIAIPPTDSAKKARKLVAGNHKTELTPDANFTLATVQPTKDAVLAQLRKAHDTDKNSQVLLHADLLSSSPPPTSKKTADGEVAATSSVEKQSPDSPENHLQTIIQAIRDFHTELGTKLSTNFKIFISSGIGQYAPKIVDNGKLAPVDKLQLESLEKIPVPHLVPYGTPEAPSNGIGYLNALAFDAHSTLRTILESAFGSIFKTKAV